MMAGVNKVLIVSEKAAVPRAPYNQAVQVGNLLYISGLIANTNEDPLKVVEGGVEEQTRQTLRNMEHILKEAGCGLSNVVRATVLLTDIQDFVRVNTVYREFFPHQFPARAAYQVVSLPNPEALVEIEAVALVGQQINKIIIQSPDAPVSSAPISQAVQVGSTVFLSGQVATRPEHPTQLVEGGLEAQAKQVFANLAHVLKAANCSFADVVKTNLLLADIADFDRINAIYRENFKSDLPARAAYQAAALPLGALVEIEAVAEVPASDPEASRKVVWTGKSPTPLAPKSQAIQAGGWLHISGQQGQTLENPSQMLGEVEAETRQALTNMGHILQAAGCTFKSVVKTTVFMSDIADFGRVNVVYKEFFTEEFPARAAYQVAGIPLAGKIQIDAVAALGI